MKEKKLKLRHIIPIFVALIINAFLLFISTYRTNYSLTLPGGLVLSNDIVSIDNAKESKGSYETIYVVSFNKSTILQNFICKYAKMVSIDLIDTNSRHFTDRENYLMGEIEHNSSVSSTIISTYNLASNNNLDVNIDYYLNGFYVTYYYEESDWQIGDQIIAINDVLIEKLYSNLTIDSGWLNNEIGTKITYIRDNKTYNMLVEDEKDNIYCYPNYVIDYDTINPKVTINRGFTNGPSGGLLRSLSLYDYLVTEDLTRGLRIAGTGTISETGNVGAIGGIKQKIYTAYSYGVDIFFCPEANYKEALEMYELLDTNMKLYQVSTLNEALEVLYDWS